MKNLKPPAPQPEAGGFVSNPAETYAAAGFSSPPPPPELSSLRAGGQQPRSEPQLTPPFLAQQDMAKGGTLVFTMGARPAKK